MFLPVPPPSLCMLTNKSAVRKYGTCCKQKIRHRTYSEKGRVPFSKRLCPVCPYGPFRHRRFNAKRMVRPENDFGLRVAQ